MICYQYLWIGGNFRGKNVGNVVARGNLTSSTLIISGAQGEYGATWKEKAWVRKDIIQGCPNTEMCRILCNASVNCNAWTFNIESFACRAFWAYTPTADKFTRHDSGKLSDTPWVSGPVTLL